MSKFFPLTVSDVKRDTRDAVVLTLQAPETCAEQFRFRQGQYVTLRTKLDGEEVRRSYSICSGVNDGTLRVGIKRVNGGLFSTFANEHLLAGAVIDAMPPMGNFNVPLDKANAKHYVGFASGSGITPLISIIRTTLESEPKSSFTLFYGNRASSTIMFRDELEDLKNTYLGRFSLIHILSREQQDVELFNGRLTGAKCDELCERWLRVASIDTAFICGPQDMMTEIAASLQKHGLNKSQIKFELFASADSGKRVKREAAAAADKGGNTCQVTIIMDGHARQFEMEKGSISVLDAASRNGIEAPFACKAGVCSTCRAKITGGEVDMDANFSLEDYEIAHGYVLTCQSYPVTNTITIDFDK